MTGPRHQVRRSTDSGIPKMPPPRGGGHFGGHFLRQTVQIRAKLTPTVSAVERAFRPIKTDKNSPSRGRVGESLDRFSVLRQGFKSPRGYSTQPRREQRVFIGFCRTISRRPPPATSTHISSHGWVGVIFGGQNSDPPDLCPFL